MNCRKKKLESTSSHLIYNGEKTIPPTTHIIHSCIGEGLAVSMGVLQYLGRNQTINFHILLCLLDFMNLSGSPTWVS